MTRAGRGAFEKAMQTMRQHELNTWDNVRFVVFDTLQSGEDIDIFENRVTQLFVVLGENPFIVSYLFWQIGTVTLTLKIFLLLSCYAVTNDI